MARGEEASNAQQQESATKADLRALQQRVDDKLEEVKQFVRQENKRTRQHIQRENEETRRHFDVVAEHIHRDVAGANADEISLLKDKQADHEQRIAALEKSP